MLDRARAAGHINGVVAHLISGGADDTMLLFQPDLLSMATIKLLLLSVQAMSGLKVIFYKSEVIAMGMNQEQGQRVANLLNCKPGALPTKYLGLPITHKNLTVAIGIRCVRW